MTNWPEPVPSSVANPEGLCVSGDHRPSKPGSWVCAQCDARLWAEVGWLVDCWLLTEPALLGTRAPQGEQVVVAGGKDPLSNGIALDEAAVRARADIRAVAVAGFGLYIRGGGARAVLPDRALEWQPNMQLGWLRYRLGWLQRRNAADPGGGEAVRDWASRVVAARIAADRVVAGPAAARTKAIETSLPCPAEGCPGLVLLVEDRARRLRFGECDTDPRHTLPLGGVLRLKARARAVSARRQATGGSP